MGSALTCPGELGGCGADVFDLSWRVPRFGHAGDVGDGGGPLCAGRPFKNGEIVELNYCIRVAGDTHLDESFLAPHLYPCYSRFGADEDDGAKLLPIGWGLLFGHDTAKANVVADHSGGRRSENLKVARGDQRVPGDWLAFRASRAIDAGEELFVLPNKTLGRRLPPGAAPLAPIFQAARSCARVDAQHLREPDELEAPHVLEDPPTVLRKFRTSAVRPGVSRIQGVGAFASEGVAGGDVVELVPMLPLVYKDIAGTAIRDFVFGGDFVPDASIVLMPLGSGGLFNHGDPPSVCPQRYASTPFVQAWVAQQQLQSGEEMFVSYGSAYWDAPWRAGHLRSHKDVQLLPALAPCIQNQAPCAGQGSSSVPVPVARLRAIVGDAAPANPPASRVVHVQTPSPSRMSVASCYDRAGHSGWTSNANTHWHSIA